MAVNIIALIVLYGAPAPTVLQLRGRDPLRLTGFVSTVAFCKYLLRGSIIE
jgi:multicomponent K+:H+ antiporter subunit F